MERKKPKKDKDKSFFQKYIGWILCLGIILMLMYVVVYFCFYGRGIIPTGMDLDKGDWLSFLGSFLAFSGTILVSLIASLQSVYYAERDEKKRREERQKAIQPIFSINIEKINGSIRNRAESFNPNDPDTFPEHKNVTIDVENVGGFPIRNVIIFDNYQYQLLKPNVKHDLQIAYSDSPDAERENKYLIEILETEYERTDDGIPKWFNISYEDVDGNDMFQSFELKEFDGTRYYSLEGIHQV